MSTIIQSCRRIRVPAAALLVALAVCSPSAAHDDRPAADLDELTKESFQWFETARAGETARVSNPHGSIFARFGGYGDQLEIIATRQRLETDRAPLEVERRRVDAGLEVVVVDPDAAADGRRDRVDLVVFVPKGVALDASTRSGSMELKKLKGDLTARSTTGDIYIRGVAGRVDASSERGHLEITLAAGATEATQRFETVTGDIQLHLWEDAAHEARLATSGEISTDFSLTIEHRRFEEPGKHAVAVINGGGPKLELTSKRGRLRLLRLPKDFKLTDTAEPTDTRKGER